MTSENQYFLLQNEIYTGLKISIATIEPMYKNMQQLVVNHFSALLHANNSTDKIKVFEYLQGYDAWKQIITHQLNILNEVIQHQKDQNTWNTSTRQNANTILALSHVQIDSAYSELRKNIESIFTHIQNTSTINSPIRDVISQSLQVINQERLNSILSFKKLLVLIPDLNTLSENIKGIDCLLSFYTTDQERNVHTNFLNSKVQTAENSKGGQSEIFN